MLTQTTRPAKSRPHRAACTQTNRVPRKTASLGLCVRSLSPIHGLDHNFNAWLRERGYCRRVSTNGSTPTRVPRRTKSPGAAGHIRQRTIPASPVSACETRLSPNAYLRSGPSMATPLRPPNPRHPCHAPGRLLRCDTAGISASPHPPPSFAPVASGGNRRGRGEDRGQPRPVPGLSAAAGPRPQSAIIAIIRGSKCRDVWPPRSPRVLLGSLSVGRSAVLLPGAPASCIVPASGGQTNAPPRINPRRGRCVGVPPLLGLEDSAQRPKIAADFGRNLRECWVKLVQVTL